MKVNIKRVAVITILSCLIAGGVYSLCNIKNSFISAENKELESMNIIYNNVFIRGNAVGGLTPNQANEMADKLINVDYSADKKINFRLAQTDFSTSFTYPELGMGFDVTSAVSQAYNFGRDKNGKILRDNVVEMDIGAKYIDAEYMYNTDEIKACLSTIEAEVNDRLKPLKKTMDLERTTKQVEQMLMVNEYDALIYIATK